MYLIKRYILNSWKGRPHFSFFLHVLFYDREINFEELCLLKGQPVTNCWIASSALPGDHHRDRGNLDCRRTATHGSFKRKSIIIFIKKYLKADRFSTANEVPRSLTPLITHLTTISAPIFLPISAPICCIIFPFAAIFWSANPVSWAGKKTHCFTSKAEGGHASKSMTLTNRSVTSMVEGGSFEKLKPVKLASSTYKQSSLVPLGPGRRQKSCIFWEHLVKLNHCWGIWSKRAKEGPVWVLSMLYLLPKWSRFRSCSARPGFLLKSNKFLIHEACGYTSSHPRRHRSRLTLKLLQPWNEGCNSQSIREIHCSRRPWAEFRKECLDPQSMLFLGFIFLLWFFSTDDEVPPSLFWA